MIDVREIVRLHQQMVAHWHHHDLDNSYEGLLEIVCQQFQFNFLLWHEEDLARSPDATDERIASVKRAIDRYNQQRNDWIERIDDWITEDLGARQIGLPDDAPLNTETPGSVIDRLSIITLRIYHLEEQLQRSDVAEDHRESVGRKLQVCRVQHQDLARSLEQLLGDIYAGRKRHRTYRMFKMYNDPALNPYLYNSARRQAG